MPIYFFELFFKKVFLFALIFCDRIVFILLNIGIIMNNLTTLEKLSEKVSNILQQYRLLKTENETLRIQVVTLKAEKEVKEQEIEKLTEQNVLKDIEIEEIVSKIESILG